MIQRMARKRLTAEERRDSILTAGRTVFLEQGLNGARTRTIAEHAGITEAVLYRHFSSKEEIFEAAVLQPLRALLDDLLERSRALLASDETRPRLVMRLESLWLERLQEIVPLLGPALFDDQTLGRECYRETVAPFLARLQAEAVAAGLVPAGEAAVLVRAIFGTNLLLVLDRLQQGERVDIPSLAGQLSDLYSLGLSGGESLRDATRREDQRPRGG
jgi:TetR/AcrR family transcriptional regulator